MVGVGGPRRRISALSVRGRNGTSNAFAGRLPGQTRSRNPTYLITPPKHHHRLKDETNWHVDQVSPGVFLWTSPTGRTYLTVLEPYDYENDSPPY
jgi:hypothetical protein